MYKSFLEWLYDFQYFQWSINYFMINNDNDFW